MTVPGQQAFTSHTAEEVRQLRKEFEALVDWLTAPQDDKARAKAAFDALRATVAATALQEATDE